MAKNERFSLSRTFNCEYRYRPVEPLSVVNGEITSYSELFEGLLQKEPGEIVYRNEKILINQASEDDIHRYIVYNRASGLPLYGAKYKNDNGSTEMIEATLWSYFAKPDNTSETPITHVYNTTIAKDQFSRNPVWAKHSIKSVLGSAYDALLYGYGNCYAGERSPYDESAQQLMQKINTELSLIPGRRYLRKALIPQL